MKELRDLTDLTIHDVQSSDRDQSPDSDREALVGHRKRSRTPLPSEEETLLNVSWAFTLKPKPESGP